MKSAPAPTHARERREPSITLLVAGAFFMENLDGTVITTAVPAMARSFGVQPLELNIGVSAYLQALRVLIPLSGWSAGRFGARRVFALAIALFTLAGVACGLARGPVEFTLLRVLQGLGGAMMVPVWRLVPDRGDEWPAERRRARRLRAVHPKHARVADRRGAVRWLHDAFDSVHGAQHDRLRRRAAGAHGGRQRR
jgi:hypothetical protein